MFASNVVIKRWDLMRKKKYIEEKNESKRQKAIEVEGNGQTVCWRGIFVELVANIYIYLYMANNLVIGVSNVFLVSRILFNDL